MLVLSVLMMEALEAKLLKTDWSPSDAWSTATCSLKAAAYSGMVSYTLEVAAVGVIVGVVGRSSRRASVLSYPLCWASLLVARLMIPYSFEKESLVVTQD